MQSNHEEIILESLNNLSYCEELILLYMCAQGMWQLLQDYKIIIVIHEYLLFGKEGFPGIFLLYHAMIVLFGSNRSQTILTGRVQKSVDFSPCSETEGIEVFFFIFTYSQVLGKKFIV